MLWIPTRTSGQRYSFSYKVAHDHAFDLMTVGFFGPGYRTSLYEFDYNEPIQRTDGLTQLSYKGKCICEKMKLSIILLIKMCIYNTNQSHFRFH